MKPFPSIDLFCRVVDNFGDIGVCWRLAQQLVRDQGCVVRLFVDDFQTFARIEPALDSSADLQTLNGVTILRWEETVIAAHYAAPSDSVIEAFACDLPQMVIDRMVAASIPPVWLDLEYLSAEDWVESHHAIPSLNPSTGLQKTLFFPGFTPKTGGLSREAGLTARRKAFQADFAAQDQWRGQHGLPPLQKDTIDISLFCYDDAPLTPLIQALAKTPQRVRFFAPEGVATAQITTLKKLTLQNTLPGNITLQTIPFLRQNDYDQLLWACHLNFVRGEDSFVRAIWAGRPFIWQIYRQEKQAHLVKLDAFLQRYSRTLAATPAESLAQFTVMWNVGGLEGGATVKRFFADLPLLSSHAKDWAEIQTGQPDLASQLVRFIQTMKKI
ncbi:MAG: elongation factor P maturation arginine rhamnosyltransferase EarP [Micavibrio sp.]